MKVSSNNSYTVLLSEREARVLHKMCGQLSLPILKEAWQDILIKDVSPKEAAELNEELYNQLDKILEER